MGMQATTLFIHLDFCHTDCEIMDRFGEKFVENECTIEEDGPDYDSITDDARSKVKNNAVEMIPPRQNIFDNSKKSCLCTLRKRRRINFSQKLQPRQAY